ncbi:MAG TPA: hypothetical protein VGK10_16240 [Prolixibacteraceae bacterium]|jgi:hypothetical protein
MYTFEIEGNRNVEKGKLKQKFALLTNNDKLLDESIDEVRLGRLQVNLGQTRKEFYHRHTSAPTVWFSDWGIDGGEKSRMEASQSEAQSKKYDPLNLLAYQF